MEAIMTTRMRIYKMISCRNGNKKNYNNIMTFVK